MKRINILLLIAIAFMLSCNKIDCRGTLYTLSISLGNYTGHELNVELFPRPEFMIHQGMYHASSIGSGGHLTEFTMNADSVQLVLFKYTIFTTNDTSVYPSTLLSRVFDSIYFHVNDSVDTEVRFYPDRTFNYSINPFQNDTIWEWMWRGADTPNNDCENPGENKNYRFYLDSMYIEQ